jgi:Lar family restriction alleviation protein
MMTDHSSTDTMAALKPCPFCGVDAEVVPVGGSPGYWVKCLGCGAEGAERSDRSGAAECWNTRVSAAQAPVENHD